MAYNLVLSSSDDEDIIEEFNRRERRFKQCINYFEELDDVVFKTRFRLNKASVLEVLENISDELEFLTNR